MTPVSPVGTSASAAGARRARRSAEYRDALAKLQPAEEIAREVLKLRMKTGLTQQELAKKLGTTKSVVSRLESGHHAPSVKTLDNIAKAFDMKLTIAFEPLAS